MGDPQTHAIIGAAMAVHSELGAGFPEHIYQRALALELKRRHVPFRLESPVEVTYMGESVGVFRIDVLCWGEIIVELKAVDRFCDAHRAQVLHYLKATGLRRGLLINFGERSLRFERFQWG